MTLGNPQDIETGLFEQGERQGIELLPVLERAGGVIGDAEPRPHHRRDQPDLVDELGDVAGDPGDIGRALGIAAVAGQDMAVVLDHGAAARGGDEDGVEGLLANDGGPGIDIAAGVAAGLLFLAEMMRKRAAAGLVLDHHDIDAMTPEQPDGGPADGGRQHLLHATEHQRDALGLGVLADLRSWLGHLRLEHARRHQRKGGGGPLKARARDEPTERPGQLAQHQREPEAAGMRQHLAQDHAQKALARRAVTLHLDARPGEIDEMHVVDPAGTGGHAGEAGEAAVDVIGHRRRHLALLEHLLHEVDAAARAVALVAGEHIGRAGRGAETAMDATPQDRIGAGDGRIGELDVSETCLHGLRPYPWVHAAGVEYSNRIEGGGRH